MELKMLDGIELMLPIKSKILLKSITILTLVISIILNLKIRNKNPKIIEKINIFFLFIKK
jgi:hypothetical protein